MTTKTNQIYINQEDLEELCSIFKKHLNPQVKVYLYGSRAKGGHRKFSDVDIALEGDVDFKTLTFLDMDLEESDLPFMVDVHRVEDLDPDFLEMVKGDFVELSLF